MAHSHTYMKSPTHFTMTVPDYYVKITYNIYANITRPNNRHPSYYVEASPKDVENQVHVTEEIYILH